MTPPDVNTPTPSAPPPPPVSVDLDAQFAALQAATQQQTTPAPEPVMPPAAEVTEIVTPKRRGRPPGSKNKTASAAGTSNGEAPKRRGRPPGSKNKPKDGVTAAPKRRGRPPKAASAANGEAPKRRGRPPGVKNKVGRPPGRRGGGVKAQAQIDKELNKQFIRESKETKTPLSVVIRNYIYKGAHFKPS